LFAAHGRAGWRGSDGEIAVYVPLPLVGRGQGWGDAAFPQALEKTVKA